MGSPTGRESYGDRVPVVVAGVTTCQSGDRESRTTGRRGTGDRTIRNREVCVMQDAGTVLEVLLVTGEPSALKGAHWVRREAARKRPAPHGAGPRRAAHPVTVPASLARTSVVVLTADLPFFRPDISPSRHTTCERRALLSVAAASRWSRLLLSRLLSAQPKSFGGKLTRTRRVVSARGPEARQG